MGQALSRLISGIKLPENINGGQLPPGTADALLGYSGGSLPRFKIRDNGFSVKYMY